MRILVSLLFLSLPLFPCPQDSAETRRQVKETHIEPQLRTVAKTICECSPCLTAAECDRFKKDCTASIDKGKCPSLARAGKGCAKAAEVQQFNSRCRDLVDQALHADTDPKRLQNAPPPKKAVASAVKDPGERSNKK
ncbi:MAG: hypothetical protein IT168_06975 [Bryobacterales bacterium]|nr:hypothetical protein [Bryobacterales bacterium]